MKTIAIITVALFFASCGDFMKQAVPTADTTKVDTVKVDTIRVVKSDFDSTRNVNPLNIKK